MVSGSLYLYINASLHFFRKTERARLYEKRYGRYHEECAKCYLYGKISEQRIKYDQGSEKYPQYASEKYEACSGKSFLSEGKIIRSLGHS